MLDQPPNLAEVTIRNEIEQEVRAEYDARDQALASSQLDRRLLALFITSLLGICLVALLLLPTLGLGIGLGVRAFRMAAGF